MERIRITFEIHQLAFIFTLTWLFFHLFYIISQNNYNWMLKLEEIYI